MRAIILALAVLAGVATLALQPAQSQQQTCGAYAPHASRLRMTYDESPIGAGITQTGTRVELWLGHSGTWTLVSIRPYAHTMRSKPVKWLCTLASGSDWQFRRGWNPGEAPL